VTTPIYYVNAKPHLGTLYSTVLADVTRRWNMLLGKPVFFLTGTDEHGQKIQERAESLGVEPKEFVDSMIEPFKKVWKQYELGYDKFIRTTDKEHQDVVVAWIKKLQDLGDIYKSVYTGWYCVPCETFVTLSTQTPKPTCPTCERPLQELSEESYFFRLSAYQDELLKFYEEHPNFITPKERMNEVISFVKSGLKDLSISRKTVGWGIPFPGDKEHTVYVWADALLNYISAIGYGKKKKVFATWWPADLQIIGKDIVRFHAVYWPAFLLAAGLQLPKKLLVHGHILMDKEKMSKSKGNVVDPSELAQTYGVEAVRYYLLRHIPVNQDGNFGIQDLENCITSDLANNLGNLLNRTISLALNNGLTTVSPSRVWESEAVLLKEKCEEAFRSYWDGMTHYQYHVALADLWKFISEVNAYFHDQKPWQVAKENKELFEEIISAVSHCLYSIAVMLWPVMPKKMEELLACLGDKLEPDRDYDEVLRKNLWNRTFRLKKSDGPLFVRPEITSLPAKKEVAPAPAKKGGTAAKKSGEITIDDFAKVELVVGTITECVPVKGSEKLLQLTVDLGKRGQRNIFAGVAKYFKPEDLIGKQGVFVANLKRRKIMGSYSEGMMLCAKEARPRSDDQGVFTIATVADKVENGTLLS